MTLKALLHDYFKLNGKRFNSNFKPKDDNDDILKDIITRFKYADYYVLYIACNALRRDIKLYVNNNKDFELFKCDKEKKDR